MTLKIGVGLFTGQIPKGSDRSFHQEYRDYLELVQLIESSGLDAAWVSEHHGAEDGYLPSLVPMLSAFAAVTERIELGTGVMLAPFHDPLRIAEDLAVVDQLSGGRVIAGFGIGWREEEFRMWNLDTKTRVGRTEELIEVVRRAWSEQRFSFGGRYFNYEDVAITPKPMRPPPIFVGGFVDDAIKRAGRIGDGYLSSRADPTRVAAAFDMAARERAAAGKAGPPMVGILQNAWVSEDPEADRRMIRDGIAHQLGVYGGWRTGSDTPGKPLEVIPPSDEDIFRTTAFGTPDEVVAFLEPLAKILAPYPDRHLILRLHYPGMEAEPAARAIELLGREVAPRLRSVTA